MPRVLLIDDHRSVVEMLRAVVEDLPGFEVVGTAVSGGEAVAACAALQPDVAILDLDLGAAAGLDVLTALLDAAPRVRTLIFSGVLQRAAIKAALAAGAFGFVEKQATLEELQQGLRELAAGRVYFTPAADRLLAGEPGSRPAGTSVRLSDRDRAVLRAIAEGCSSKEISDRLGLTAHSVNNVRLRLMRRANLRGTAQLVRFAVSLGLVSARVDGAAEPR